MPPRYFLKIAIICACCGSFVDAADPSAVRERISLNAGWRFTKDDPPGVDGKLDYAKIKAWILPTGAGLTHGPALAPKSLPPGNPAGEIAYALTGFDDSQWRMLNLPHDWGIEGPFKQEYPGDTGKLAWWGVGWYRKHLAIPHADAQRKIYLDVDGAMSYATVWLNGQLAGGWPYGYTSWRVDLTPFVKVGADNVLAIRLDNINGSSRWYPGGGIYRNVWLVKTAAVHVAQWGTHVTTPEVSKKSATVNVQVTVANDSTDDASVSVQNQIFELMPDGGQGKPVASLAASSIKIPARQSVSSEARVLVKDPRLWSIGTPARYMVVTTIKGNSKQLDRVETPFGIRSIEFSSNKGFLLNGERVAIKGVCNHHDLGALGTAINVRAMERQVEILKAMGCNAIRTSHNPPAPELLDVCDRLGMVVVDEAFDCWKQGKNGNDYNRLFAEWHEQDLRAMVRRDRNHPCVVLWSTGNEVPDQESGAGPSLAVELRNIVRSEDMTRPVAAGCDRVSAAYNGFQNGVDVFGFNYKPHEYAKFHAAHPAQPVFGSETASTLSSRGEYFFPITGNGQSDFQLSSYDLFQPGWGCLPDKEFDSQEENPFVLGEFVWTGFDYLGEPTPYNNDMTVLSNFHTPEEKARAEAELKALGKIKVPSRSSYFGILDLAGFPKDRFYLYQSHWYPELPMAHILPHWNWPERVGQTVPVFVYTSGDEAELFLNGKSQGRLCKAPKKASKSDPDDLAYGKGIVTDDNYRLRWNNVVYEPGELKVVAYKEGKKWAEEVMTTAASAAKLMLKPDRSDIKADGQDLSFVTVTIADKNGRLVPRSNNLVEFEISGPGEIVAVDNGDATSFESFKGKQRKAYNGLALVVVRSKPGQTGNITLTAKAAGMQSEKSVIRAK